jgi:trehalose synthase
VALHVAEAMWKARPIAASRMGGIQDQIEHGASGVLLDEPAALAKSGAAVCGLLDDPAAATAMGIAARGCATSSWGRVRCWTT